MAELKRQCSVATKNCIGFYARMIQELMVILYPPRGPIRLTDPWGSTIPRAFENVGWTQRNDRPPLIGQFSQKCLRNVKSNRCFQASQVVYKAK